MKLLVDHFPSTHATWLDAQLTIAEDGDRAAAGGDPGGSARALTARDAMRRHVMDRYHDALVAYATASGLRSAGEPDEIVAGFYAGSLADPAFFGRWRTSGITLRRWLMNAVSFHCRGLRRDATRERGRMESGLPVEDRGAEIAESGAAEAFDRAWALAIVNDAYARVQDELASGGGGGLEDEVLRMHVIDGMPYEAIARAVGVTRNDCFNAARRMASRVREAVRDLLREEGVAESSLEDAIAEVLRLVDRG